MPERKEIAPEPTEQERETAFAPHKSPAQQPDGDPGGKYAGDPDVPIRDGEAEPGETAGQRGGWNSPNE